MDLGISQIPNMSEYGSISSQNAHKSLTNNGLETKTESESRVLNIVIKRIAFLFWTHMLVFKNTFLIICLLSFVF